MRVDLQRRWGITATVLYDTPPARFRECSDERERAVVRRALGERLGVRALATATSAQTAVLVSSTRLAV
jgi:hypothetical protein